MKPYSTETLQHSGRAFRVELYADDYAAPPWEAEDGHGEVIYLERGERPGPGFVHLWDDRHGTWVYGFGAALLQASRDGWGLSPDALAALTRGLGKKPTRGQIRAEAVRADMRHMAGYLRGDWGYVGVSVSLLDSDGEPVDVPADVWSVESNGWEDVARELADGILCDRRDTWRKALREARARRYWESRDVQTVGA